MIGDGRWPAWPMRAFIALQILGLASCGTTSAMREDPPESDLGLIEDVDRSVVSDLQYYGADTNQDPNRLPPSEPVGQTIPIIPADGGGLDGGATSLAPSKPQPQLFRGRSRANGGQLFARQEATANERKVALNFDGAEIAEVAQIVLGDILNVNHTVDPTVKGQIRLKSTEPVPVSAALGILETTLRQNNAALVVDGSLYRIVPADKAMGLGSVPELVDARRPIPPGFSIRIVPLRFIAAEEMVKILEPFVGNSGVTRVDPNRNLLVLAGTSRELQFWLETVETFDVDWFRNKSVGLYPLTEANAGTVIRELQRIFGLSSDIPRGAVEFLPIERLNAVMAIAYDPTYLDRVSVWVDRLDAGSPTGRRLYVYRMKHGKAADLAPILAELFTAGGGNLNSGAGFDPLGSSVAPGLEMRTLVSSNGAQIPMGGAAPSTTAPVQPLSVGAAPSMAVPGGPGGGFGGGGLASQAAPQSFGDPNGIQIVANIASNSLVIRATAAEYRSITEALRELDVPPLQVLVEATIVEVQLSDELRYGVQAFLEFNDVFGTGEPLTADLVSGLAASAGGFTLIGGALNEGSRIVLDALEEVTDFNIVSSPNLMVLDNQTASLNVGDEVPIATQTVGPALVEDDVLNTTIERRNTGVIFQVTPRINVGGTITLEIVQEISTVLETTEETVLAPTISTRRIESSVVTQSGETIILGGLFSESAAKSRSGLPFLSRIPGLGWIFRSTLNTYDQTELLVLISPRVVKNQSEARLVTQEMRSRVRELDLLRRE